MFKKNKTTSDRYLLFLNVNKINEFKNLKSCWVHYPNYWLITQEVVKYWSVITLKEIHCFINSRLSLRMSISHFNWTVSRIFSTNCRFTSIYVQLLICHNISPFTSFNIDMFIRCYFFLVQNNFKYSRFVPFFITHNKILFKTNKIIEGTDTKILLSKKKNEDRH